MMPSDRQKAAAAPELVQFRPASSFSYECSIHTLEVHDEQGSPYSVVLDLIRTGKNPSWGISADRIGLRAAVVDAERRVVASLFADLPAGEFLRTIGELYILGEPGRIAFRSARAPDGKMLDGGMDFDMSVTFFRSSVAQQAADLLKTTLDRSLAERGVSPADGTPVELFVEDYPRTEHTGSIWVKRPGQDEPLRLIAARTPSTVSHHYGNALPHYIFLASVRRRGEPSIIAVIAHVGVDLSRDKVGPEVRLPIGYLIRTDDAAGTSMVQPLNVKLGEHHGPELGGGLFGTNVDFKIATKVGSVALNEGALPTWTGFGSATVHGSHFLASLGRDEEVERFPDVLVDLAGTFVGQAGLG